MTGATVAFGTGYPATSVVVVSATSITCVSPAHVAGVVDVTVITPAGTSATTGTGNDYTYGAPTVTALNPTGRHHARRHGGHHHRHELRDRGHRGLRHRLPGHQRGGGERHHHHLCLSGARCRRGGRHRHHPTGTSATTGTGNDYAYGIPKFVVTMTGGTTPLSAVAKTAGTPFSVRVTAQDAVREHAHQLYRHGGIDVECLCRHGLCGHHDWRSGKRRSNNPDHCGYESHH